MAAGVGTATRPGFAARGMDVRVEVLGDVALSRRFLRVGENASDLSASFETILEAFGEWVEEQYDSDGREFGTPWDPLAETTIAQKAAAGYDDPGQALDATGVSRASFQGGGFHVHEVGPDEAAWGSTAPNVMWHQGRTRSASNPVPRRPVFDPDEAKRRWMMRVLQAGVFGAGGFRSWRSYG